MLEKLRNAVLLVVGGLVAFWAVTALVGVVQGGPMDPPGAPGETMLPLNDVEARVPLYSGDMPYNLSVSGSYYLTEDLYGDEGDDGITISADNVTLDLNGFAIIGPGKAVGSDDGVFVWGDNVSILNGTVRDWGDDGVCADGIVYGQFEHLRLYNNGDDGLVAGNWATVMGCIASHNGGDGFTAFGGCIVTDCVSHDNANGFYVGGGTIVSNCTAPYNTSAGINAFGDALVIGNSVFDNTTRGIMVSQGGNHIEGNRVEGNGIGIDAFGTGHLIIKNTATGNTTDYSIPSGSTVGPIYGVADPIPGTNPWANFSY